MTLKDFRKLDKHEQAEVVWDGILLADRAEASFRYILYQVDDFYVELRYDTEHNLLTGLRSFDDKRELEPYLEQIRLHLKTGRPKANLTELREKALQILPKDTITDIISREEKDLDFLHYSLGVHLRNQLDLWHTEVRDEKGFIIHPDDVAQALIKEIWHFNH